MSRGHGIVDLISQRQDLDQFRKKNWEGTFEEYLDLVRERPEGHAQCLRARLRHDPVVRHRRPTRRPARSAFATASSTIRTTTARTPSSAWTSRCGSWSTPSRAPRKATASKSACCCCTARSAAARARSPGCSRRGWSATRRRDAGRAVHARLGRCRGPQHVHWCPMHEEPLHLIPERFRDEVARGSTQAAAEHDYQVQDPRRAVPVLPLRLRRAAEAVRRRLDPRDPGRPRQAADPEREGPHRHRHVPAQGREEPGLDRADRRHQLPQDRRVRQRQRSAGVQLRRRVQRRQPRHHRVRRSAQARRGVPVRPAGRQPGAQGQAEEVRPDRHRRSDPRPHQRAGIPPAAEQRVHGGPPRPHGEDRRAVRHQAGRRDQDLREGLQQGQGAAASTSPRTRSRWPPCGRSSRGWKSRRTPA